MEDLNPIRRWFAEWRTRWHNINGTAVLRLGDAAGESRLSIRNSDDEEVFYFASNGTSNIEPIDGEEGQALLRGGGRSLIGNLVVATGVTVDGVDISSFSADTASWQSAHTASGQHDVLQSSSFSSGAYGYRLSNDGNAEFNNVRVRGELSASAFTINEIAASAGTLGVFKSAGVVWANFTTPSAIGGAGTLLAKNSYASASLFAAGDRLEIKAWTGTAIVDIWLEVTASTNNTDHTSYSVALRSGSTSVVIPAGVAIADWGPSGSGAVTLSADGTIGASANLSVQSHAGSPWSTRTLHLRLGNLNGSYGYSTNTYGFATGNSAATFLAVDSTNGFRIVDDTITRFQVDAAGAMTIRNAAGSAVITMDSTSARIDNVLNIGTSGGIYQGTGTFGTPTTGLKIWNDSGVGRIGGYSSGVLQWYANSDGTLKAGGGDVTLDSDGISLVSWLSSRGSLGSVNGYRFSAASTTFCGLYAQTNSTVQTNVQLLNYGVTQPGITIEAQDTATTGGSYSDVTITASGPSYSANARLDANAINLYGKGLRVTSGYDATAAAAGTLYTSGTATVSGGLNVGSATGAATGEIKASAALSATTGTFSSSSNPRVIIDSTGSGGASRSFLRFKGPTSSTDFMSFGYYADGSPTRMQIMYGGESVSLPIMSLTSTNRVGVNVSVPGYTLDVDGNVRFTEGLNVGSATSAAEGQIFAAGSAANSDQKVLDIRNNASASGLTLRTVSVSMFGVNEDARIVAGNEATGLGATGFLALYTRTSDALGAQEKVRISAAGRVGIGTSAPGYLLDVSGDVRFTGGLNVGATGAADGTIKTTTGGNSVTINGTTSSLVTINKTGSGAQTSELLVQSNSTNVARFGWSASGYVDISALLTNNDIQLNPSGTGRVRSGGLLTVEGDGTGIASTVGISNVNNVAANSTGTGTIKFKSATSRDSSGFIKIYVGTTAYWVPFFSAVT